jgi:hypothetical protein
VHEIWLELLHRPGDATIHRRREANVGIRRERHARNLHMEIGGAEIVDELLHP